MIDEAHNLIEAINNVHRYIAPYGRQIYGIQPLTVGNFRYIAQIYSPFR